MRGEEKEKEKEKEGRQARIERQPILVLPNNLKKSFLTRVKLNVL